MGSEERCVCCGAVIPEGRQVCPKCAESTSTGIVCPECGAAGYVRVMQTFNMRGWIRRRRKCRECGKLFYTGERVE